MLKKDVFKLLEKVEKEKLIHTIIDWFELNELDEFIDFLIKEGLLIDRTGIEFGNITE